VANVCSPIAIIKLCTIANGYLVIDLLLRKKLSCTHRFIAIAQIRSGIFSSEGLAWIVLAVGGSALVKVIAVFAKIMTVE
jgi:hypothetical protein